MSEDYPRTLMDLGRSVFDRGILLQYLAAMRWSDGFAVRDAVERKRGKPYEGGGFAGTIFADSHLPLRLRSWPA